MKKTVATFCLLGATLALSACDTTTTTHTSASFANERTASYDDGMMTSPVAATPTRVAPAEKVFQRAQTK